MSEDSPQGSGAARSGFGALAQRLADAAARSLGAHQSRDEAAVSPDPWDELRRELGRSRRYERPFALVAVDCHFAEQDGRGEHPEATRLRALQLSAFLRSVDRAWSANGSVYLLLPECDRAMGEALVARVRKQAPELVPDGRVGLVAFPDDGLTSGALLSALQGHPLTPEHAAREIAREQQPAMRAVVNLRPTTSTDDA